MPAKPRKAAKRIASPEELANDPSLKWNDYRLGEAIHSDALGTCRFHHRDDAGQLHLADMAIRELPGSHSPLSVRRIG